MKDEERPVFAAQLALLAEVYGRHVSQEVAEVYYRILRPFEMADLATAIDHTLRTSRYFPMPSELLEACRDSKRERLVIESASLKSLPRSGTLTDEERRDVVTQMREFTDRLAGSTVQPPAQSEPSRTVVDMNDEVARLRAADRAARGLPRATTAEGAG